MLQTEEMIAAGADSVTTAGLVKLAAALNVQSSVIRTYAEEQGLAEPTPTFVLEEAAVATAAPPSPATPAPIAAAEAITAATITAAVPITAPVAVVDLPAPTAAASASTAAQGKATGLILSLIHI